MSRAEILHLTTALPAPASLFGLTITALPLWLARQRSRRALTRLDARQLHDIGLTTETAQAESQKPFWRA